MQEKPASRSQRQQRLSWWPLVVQAVTMFAFAVLTLVLPRVHDEFFARPARVTVLHAACWVVVALCASFVRASLPDTTSTVLTEGAAKVQVAAQVPTVVLSLGNAIFLILVAVDGFLADSAQSTLVTDNIVCTVAWLEMLAVLASVSYCLYNSEEIDQVLRHSPSRSDRADSRGSQSALLPRPGGGGSPVVLGLRGGTLNGGSGSIQGRSLHPMDATSSSSRIGPYGATYMGGNDRASVPLSMDVSSIGGGEGDDQSASQASYMRDEDATAVRSLKQQLDREKQRYRLEKKQSQRLQEKLEHAHKQREAARQEANSLRQRLQLVERELAVANEQLATVTRELNNAREVISMDDHYLEPGARAGGAGVSRLGRAALDSTVGSLMSVSEDERGSMQTPHMTGVSGPVGGQRIGGRRSGGLGSVGTPTAGVASRRLDSAGGAGAGAGAGVDPETGRGGAVHGGAEDSGTASSTGRSEGRAGMYAPMRGGGDVPTTGGGQRGRGSGGRKGGRRSRQGQGRSVPSALDDGPSGQGTRGKGTILDSLEAARRASASSEGSMLTSEDEGGVGGRGAPRRGASWRRRGTAE